MKVLKILGGILLTLIVLFFIIGFFLPKSYSVSRSIEINKPDSTVYQKALDFNDFAKWNPWMEMEPSAKKTVTGDGVSVGSVFSWVGKEVGTGSMTIEKLNPYKQIDERLNFIEPFESTALTSFYFEPLPNGSTKVTWDFRGESTSIMERWMSLTFESMLGKDYEKGLSNLKALSEK
ncbi:SRPBCC family protein [Pedobacter metabolipauper]|uniref:Polyketide cyclase/dehydrase/lipid transport protein n=1 Tax=Pedobacter metabolipauper TaxID=425513 RepID=A0A4R6SXS0_9SPHI|nr:SRPBCC family protein [Pedobacter metabolipauper]TDQ10256.1 polyketide cyclase/dehydrase/lipid transport protein [Pedobacter metabolipauper]